MAQPAFPRSADPADAIAVRVVAEDLSLTPDDWIAVTPPRVPELRSLQEYIGSKQPVLMDWAVGLAFPCQQPMLHVYGVTEIPKFRITPRLQRQETGHRHLAGRRQRRPAGNHRPVVAGPRHVHLPVPDWGRDWGSLRKFDTLVDAQPAELDLGTATHFGWWSPGKIRIKP